MNKKYAVQGIVGCVYTAIMSIIIAGIDYLVLRFLMWR